MALPLLTQKDWQWLHLTGTADFEPVKAAYAARGIRAVVKPFLLEILLARVSAIARRALPTMEPQAIRAGGIVLDRSRRLAIRQGKHIYLTRKQFDLLELLMKRSGLITSREQLIEAGWGCDSEVKENTLDVYIHGLRAKLEDKKDDDHTLIRTIHRSGYMFAEN